MKIVKADNYEKMIIISYNLLKNEIEKNNNLVLGLPTGETPLGLYKMLIKSYQNKEISFNNIITFNLDEYVGLTPENKNSYHYYMYNNLFDHININKNNVYIPNGLASDIEKECQEYENKIDSFGIDIMFLGIGENGHIGFNEPNDFFISETHKVKLDEKTKISNSRFFKSYEEVPDFAISMGIKSIFKSKKIILLANGEKKAQAVYNTIKGNITPLFQSSILQLHSDTTIILCNGADKYL